MATWRILLALLCLLTLATSVSAGSTWVLWSRPCDFPPVVRWCGEYQRGPVFETERACEAARLNAVNRPLTPMESQEQDIRRRTVIDYTCLPDTVDPRGPKGK